MSVGKKLVRAYMHNYFFFLRWTMIYQQVFETSITFKVVFFLFETARTVSYTVPLALHYSWFLFQLRMCCIWVLWTWCSTNSSDPIWFSTLVESCWRMLFCGPLLWTWVAPPIIKHSLLVSQEEIAYLLRCGMLPEPLLALLGCGAGTAGVHWS